MPRSNLFGRAAPGPSSPLVAQASSLCAPPSRGRLARRVQAPKNGLSGQHGRSTSGPLGNVHSVHPVHVVHKAAADVPRPRAPWPPHPHAHALGPSWEGEAPAEPQGWQMRLSRSFALPRRHELTTRAPAQPRLRHPLRKRFSLNRPGTPQIRSGSEPEMFLLAPALAGAGTVGITCVVKTSPWPMCYTAMLRLTQHTPHPPASSDPRPGSRHRVTPDHRISMAEPHVRALGRAGELPE